MRLSVAQLDRAEGVLLGTAAGDALGAGYEFGDPLSDDAEVAMKGGGPFDWPPGSWTDDTAMAIVIAQVAVAADLRDEAAQDEISCRWADWARTAPDVGSQTRAVLSVIGDGSWPADCAGAGRAVRDAARSLHEATGRSAGNGSLMRTAPVAVAYLGDSAGLTEAAASLSALTHFDPEAGDACVLWCLAISHAVLTGELDARAGLGGVPAARRDTWARRLAEAEAAHPRDFPQNGWVVHALQGAWSAITATRGRAAGPEARLTGALETAVRGGRDTDTVAAIAGGLLGAAYGAAAVPRAWRDLVHGWPGLGPAGLAELTTGIVSRLP